METGNAIKAETNRLMVGCPPGIPVKTKRFPALPYGSCGKCEEIKSKTHSKGE